jgi:alpha-L-rhamnosidase
MPPYALRVEHLATPLGLDFPTPRFSWKLRGAGPAARQSAYRLIVAPSPAAARTGADALWDSAKALSCESHLVPYAGPALAPRTRYWWTVRTWDAAGRPGPTASSWFETGFLGAPWPAQWIEPPVAPPEPPGPAWLVRGRFRLAAAPRSARLYITARGWFEPWLDGARIGAEHLAPGWTDYRKRIEYLVYDVTSRLGAGDHVLGAWLADGWACCKLMGSSVGHYADRPCLLAALAVEYAGRRTEWFGSGPAWQCRRSPVTAAGLYEGEDYDARLECPRWSRPGSGEAGWEPVALPAPPPAAVLSAKALPPVRTIEERAPRSITRPRPGAWVFDFGQNFAGVVRIRIRGKRGDRIVLRHAEMLRPDGTLYTDNLRSARATDTCVCRGGRTEVWHPRFTFHGFRYVEVTGLRGRPTRGTVTGLAWSSDLAPAGHFECSHPLVNQLQRNIQWGQRGNFLDVPSDCPQRDERLGWTADAQVFAPTALFNFDSTAFLRKFCHDLRDGQDADGAFPDVAPEVLQGFAPPPEPGWKWCGNAAWADAGAVVPWLLYERSGDLGVLRENLAAMIRWVDFQERTSRGLVRPPTNYGDWVAPDAVRPDWAPTPCDLLGTAWFARSTDLAARAATLLGAAAEAVRLRALHERIVSAFRSEFVAPSGRLAGDTQTAYCLALAFDLLPETLRPAAVGHLRRAIERRGGRLCTGFVGTPLLCPVLTRFGAHDLACRILRHEDYPSWLLPVKNGATTMWERWNSWTSDGGFGPAGMNSFNHYAFGAVGDWLYRCVAGLDPSGPGWRELRFQPRPGGGLTRASAWHDTPYGRAESGWTLARGKAVCSFLVPANTTATAILPASAASNIAVRGPAPVDLRPDDGGIAAALCPGRWRFAIESPLVVPP